MFAKGGALRLDSGIRGLFGKLVKKGLTVTQIAEMFDTTRQTVHRWLKRTRHVDREYYKDKPRSFKPGKVINMVKVSILAQGTTSGEGQLAYSRASSTFQASSRRRCAACRGSASPGNP